MKKGLFGTVATLLAGAGLSFAEAPTLIPGSAPMPVVRADDKLAPEIIAAPKDDLPANGAPPTVALPAPALHDGNCCQPLDCCDCCDQPVKFYGSAEYLLWWIKDNPLPPLATSNATVVPALGTPGTSVVLGGSDLNMREQHGARTTVGVWLGGGQTLGVEASYFFLGKSTSSASVGNGGLAGDPILGIPFFSPAGGIFPAGESAVGFSNPGFGGNATVTVESFLQGAEANVIWNLGGGSGLRFGVLGGFRFLQLQEKLNFSVSQTINGTGIFNTVTDQFNTQNRFYGGQIGARAEWTGGRLFASASGKVGFGTMRQSVDIFGTFTDNINGTGTSPGGIFAQASNIGHHTHEEFSVIPEVNLNVGVNVTRNISAYVGYTFLYADNVLRPGNAIDRNVNLSQSPFFGGGTLVGPAVPQPQFNQSDFWAQGVNFGIQIRY